MKKKLLAIVVVITTVLVLSFAGCTTGDKIPEEQSDDKTPEVMTDENILETSNEEEAIIPDVLTDEDFNNEGGTTFEEFCVGMKDDLSEEVLEEVRDLYEQWVEAEKNMDSDRMTEIYEQLVDLDVLTMEENSSYKVG